MRRHSHGYLRVAARVAATCAAALVASCGPGAPDTGDTGDTRAALSEDEPPSAPGHPALDPPPQEPGPPLTMPPVRPPPKLDGSDASVEAFIAWAVASTEPERELGRAVIADAAHDPKNVALLGTQLATWRRTDTSRALVILAILGELRTPDAEAQLSAFLDLKPDPNGVIVEGEDGAAAALAMLQAKAIDGLAYQGTTSADKRVLALAAAHPELAVRSEAMIAYRWNHGDTEATRKLLLAHVRPDEARYIDRIVKLPSDDEPAFDDKLARYLAAHPEAKAPEPQLVK